MATHEATTASRPVARGAPTTPATATRRGHPRDRVDGDALPTDVARFQDLVCVPLKAADPSGQRWLAALGAFELLRHGAAEAGKLFATSKTITQLLGIAASTWQRTVKGNAVGYGPLLGAAGLLRRDDWDVHSIPSWQALQNRAPDKTLQGRFVYTHRPTFRATVVRWRLEGVSLAAIGAWSLLRYSETRWETGELPLCDAQIARRLGIKHHTWASYAAELTAQGALLRDGSGAGSTWRLPLYFVLRTGRDADAAAGAQHSRHVQLSADSAVQESAHSASPDADSAGRFAMDPARVEPPRDPAVQEHPAATDVDRAITALAELAGDAFQRRQVRDSAVLRQRLQRIQELTGWSGRRMFDELTRRELRSAAQPVRVLAHRANLLLEQQVPPKASAPRPCPSPQGPTPSADRDTPYTAWASHIDTEANDHVLGQLVSTVLADVAQLSSSLHRKVAAHPAAVTATLVGWVAAEATATGQASPLVIVEHTMVAHASPRHFKAPENFPPSGPGRGDGENLRRRVARLVTAQKAHCREVGLEW